jgi:peptide/nickel transport system substrate-binding protein
MGGGCGCLPPPHPPPPPSPPPPPPPPPPPAAPTEAFATGATLTVGLSGDPVNWNPLAGPARADPALAAVTDAVLPSAFVAGPGRRPTRNDALLLSATETAGAVQTVVYTINPRATWSDGVPITGADFVYTWQAQSGSTRFRDRGGQAFTPASTAGYSLISSVTSRAGDPDRVVVRFAGPDADWQSLFDPILPARVARAVGFDHGFTDPVTSLMSGGPFLVESYQPGLDVVLVRNPGWWGAPTNLSELDVAFVDSAAEAAESLEQGLLDAAVSAFTPATVATLRATAGLTVSVTTGTEFDDLVFDERSGPLAVRAVRLAVMLAVDRQALAREAAVAGDTAAAPVGNRVFPPGTAGYADDAGGAVPDSGDRAEAAQLLAAAGYVTRGSALTHGGTPVHLTLVVDTTSPLASAEVAAVVGGCRALGIAVATTTEPGGSEPLPARDSMALVQAPLTASPSVLTATYGTGGAANLSGYSSPVMDGLLALLGEAGSVAEGDAIADRVDARAWSDAVDLPLLGVPRVLAFQSRYANLVAAPTATGIGGDEARWGIPQSA